MFGENSELKDFVRASAGGFIGSFAGYLGLVSERQNFNADEVTARALISYLSICPEYDSYLLSYYVADNFNDVWSFLNDSIPESLVMSGKASRLDGSYI